MFTHRLRAMRAFSFPPSIAPRFLSEWSNNSCDVLIKKYYQAWLKEKNDQKGVSMKGETLSSANANSVECEGRGLRNCNCNQMTASMQRQLGERRKDDWTHEAMGAACKYISSPSFSGMQFGTISQKWQRIIFLHTPLNRVAESKALGWNTAATFSKLLYSASQIQKQTKQTVAKGERPFTHMLFLFHVCTSEGFGFCVQHFSTPIVPFGVSIAEILLNSLQNCKRWERISTEVSTATVVVMLKIRTNYNVSWLEPHPSSRPSIFYAICPH